MPETKPGIQEPEEGINYMSLLVVDSILLLYRVLTNSDNYPLSLYLSSSYEGQDGSLCSSTTGI